MKFLLALIFSISFCSNASANESQAGYSRSKTCIRNEYREQYYPGTKDSPGYVESWTETIEVPCKTTRSTKYASPVAKDVDNNDCSQAVSYTHLRAHET